MASFFHLVVSSHLKNLLQRRDAQTEGFDLVLDGSGFLEVDLSE